MCWQKHKRVSDANILNLFCLTACQERPELACLSSTQWKYWYLPMSKIICMYDNSQDSSGRKMKLKVTLCAGIQQLSDPLQRCSWLEPLAICLAIPELRIIYLLLLVIIINNKQMKHVMTVRLHQGLSFYLVAAQSVAGPFIYLRASSFQTRLLHL